MDARTCSTRKRRFGSEAEAARALARIQDHPDPTRLYVPVGYVWCPRCRGHHLTSKTAKKPGRRSRGQITTKGRRR